MKVAVVGTDPRLFGAVADALEEEGIATGRFADHVALITADKADRADTEIVYAAGFVPVGAKVFAALPSMTGLVSPFTGVEGFDRRTASTNGILIGNGQIAENVDSMAEATVLMLLAAAYRLPDAMAAMTGGAWPRPAARGRMIREMTVGLVGFGRIAQGVCARLRPFGCQILIHAPRLREPLPMGVEAVSLVDLADRSDAIVVLASLGPTTRHLVDAGLIGRFKRDVIVVNTARGGLIDEAALAAAAAAGKLAVIALDVFEIEPLPGDSPLRSLSNAILTPHTIGHTRETIERLPLHALNNIRRLLRREPPLSLVNPEALPTWRARIKEIAA